MPYEFFLIADGIRLDREYQQMQDAKSLYLLRILAAKAMAESTGKPVDPLDIMRIPEFDESVLMTREQRKKEQEKKDKEVYEKYKRLERK